MGDATNPFSSDAAMANSNYAAFEDGKLVHPITRERPTPLTTLVHDELRALILNDHFSCVGGRAALRQGQYRFGMYADLGSADAVAGLARDLFAFTAEVAHNASFTTYLASFSGPTALDEAAFEKLLWDTLQQLHDVDVVHHDWDRAVASDPSDPHFSFSFAGTAFFVVGLHAASSRVARRFAWPTLVFNPHEQFEALREHGQFERFQQVIRQNEQALQGGINPVLSNHGEQSDARQYSGRAVGGDWRCPFEPHVTNKPD
jgi:FPC/CPF motif-containing protein YcgG